MNFRFQFAFQVDFRREIFLQGVALVRRTSLSLFQPCILGRFIFVLSKPSAIKRQPNGFEIRYTHLQNNCRWTITLVQGCADLCGFISLITIGCWSFPAHFFLDLLTHINNHVSAYVPWPSICHLYVPCPASSIYSKLSYRSFYSKIYVSLLWNLHGFLFWVIDGNIHLVCWSWNCMSFLAFLSNQLPQETCPHLVPLCHICCHCCSGWPYFPWVLEEHGGQQETT